MAHFHWTFYVDLYKSSFSSNLPAFPAFCTKTTEFPDNSKGLFNYKARLQTFWKRWRAPRQCWGRILRYVAKGNSASIAEAVLNAFNNWNIYTTDHDVTVALPVRMSNISQHKSEHTGQLQGSLNVTSFSLPASMQWLGLALYIQYTRSAGSNLQHYFDYCLKCMTMSKKRTHLWNAFSQASKNGILLVFLPPQCHRPCWHARHHKSNAKFSITRAQ